MDKDIIFNKKQQVAINHKEGAMGVIASAGSGKTSILLGRIDNLIKEHKVFEGDILAISFTRDTADELESRLKKMGHHHVNVGTFHSICGRILNQEGIRINGYNLVKEWQIDNCFKNIDQKADVKEIMNFISYQKSYMRTYRDEFKPKYSSYPVNELRVFFRAYEDMKTKQTLYDFDDYLLLTLDILKKNPGKYTYDYIMVDEHQDSNKIQNMLLQEWSKAGNIFTASDYRQAIYSFRGGTTEYSMNFESYWEDSQVHNVNINYRSPQNIVYNSNEFIKRYYGDYEHYVDATANKQFDGQVTINYSNDREQESQVIVNQIEKLISEETELNEIAVLYRVNSHADFVEAELKKREIEYDIANNSSFFKRREVAGIIAYLRLIYDNQDGSAFENIFRFRADPLKYMSNKVLNDIQNLAQREGISQYEAALEVDMDKVWQKRNMRLFSNQIDRLTDLANDGINVISLIDNIVRAFKIKQGIKERYTNNEELEERLNSIEVLKSFVKGNNLEQFITYVYSNTDKKKKKDHAVRLMSIHRSKGLEFDNVFVIGIEDGKFPHINSMIDEEARLFYVATTRSKLNLWINEIGKGNRFVEEYGYDKHNTGAVEVVKSDIKNDNEEVMRRLEERMKWD